MATCFGGASLAAADDREAPCARLVPVVPFFVRALSVSAVVFVIPLLMARVGRRPASVVSRSVPGRTGADADCCRQVCEAAWMRAVTRTHAGVVSRDGNDRGRNVREAMARGAPAGAPRGKRVPILTGGGYGDRCARRR